ncbi:unnamed protein product [Brachionus calyciflorus]|uniref:Innexin n=1 Tax=Brachionus calyciflorus TaxID=104777 RepID=A0A813MA15_9BILA|nr:unnamed protein product [Brachionus calyciflorus]
MDVLTLANRVNGAIFGVSSDDDFSDRLNYRYTVGLLVLFSIILTSRQYSSEVIKCWVPAHFTSNYEQYVSQICWITNTYYFDLDQKIPKSEVERSKNEIKYYQWVSFVLLIQALLFYMPRIFWRTISLKAGLNISDLVEAAQHYKSADKFENRKSYMKYLVKNIDQYVDDSRRYESERNKNPLIKYTTTAIPWFGKYLGNYIVILYFVVKGIYILNTCFQIFIISFLLGKSFWYFGYDFLINLITGQGWTVTNSKYFPKVTLCDFNIREVGNPNKSHKYTVQCVLPINLFNQQIFTGIWFWYLLVLFWNVIEMVVWIRRCLPAKSKKWIERRVSLITKSILIKKDRLDHFIDTYLEPDGIFMIRMIANNTSDFVATDLIHQLWCQHAENYDQLFSKDEPHNVDDSLCVFEHKKKTDEPKHHSTNQSHVNEEFNREYLSFGQAYNQINDQETDLPRDLSQIPNILSQISYNRTVSEKNARHVDFHSDTANLLDNNDTTLQHRKRELNNQTKV